jgi:2-polyprenyl-3-methyl-5-hydroxy-6-metoxy-1,4-benzoquinol methylase
VVAERLETVVKENVRSAFTQVDFSRIKPYVDRILHAVHAHPRGPGGLLSMRFLDFGCGFGRMVAAAREAGFGFVHGYDAAPAMVDLARQAVPDDRVMITDRMDRLADQYDIIVCEDVIEHCLDPAAVLLKLFSLLSPGGVLFLNTPVISGLSGRLLGQAWWCAGPADHLQLYTEKALSRAVEDVGFCIVDRLADCLIPWFERPTEGAIEAWAERVWHRANRAVQAGRSPLGDNLVMRLCRPAKSA